MKHGDRMTVNVLGRDVEVIADERVPKGAIVPVSAWERFYISRAAEAAVAAAKCSPDDYIFREGDFSTAYAARATKRCEQCDGTGTDIYMDTPCGVCGGSRVVPSDAPSRVDGWAYYCHECGFLKPFGETAGGECYVHPHGEKRAFAFLYGFGEAIEQGLRAIAGWPDANENEPQAPGPLTCDECGVKLFAAVYDNGFYRCAYCDHRTSHAVGMVENGCGITAAPAPVVDEDGDAWMTAAWES